MQARRIRLVAIIDGLLQACREKTRRIKLVAIIDDLLQACRAKTSKPPNLNQDWNSSVTMGFSDVSLTCSPSHVHSILLIPYSNVLAWGWGTDMSSSKPLFLYFLVNYVACVVNRDDILGHGRRKYPMKEMSFLN